MPLLLLLPSSVVYNMADFFLLACEWKVKAVKKSGFVNFCSAAKNHPVFFFLFFSAFTLTEKVVCLIHSP